MSVLHMMAYSQFAGMPVPSLQQVKTAMMEKINLKADQAKLNELTDLLNQIVRSNEFEQSGIPKQLLARLPQIVKQGANEAVQEFKITKDLKVYTQASSNAWKKYMEVANQYRQAVNSGLDAISLAKEADAAKKEALSLQGRLSSLSGQALESLLQVLLPQVKQGTADMTGTIVKSVVDQLKTMQTVETLGTKNESITLVLDDEVVKISSQGKIDVQTSSPFIGEEDIMKISAKNYSKLRDIHLLSGGSVVGLISQWPTSESVKNYYYNALGVWNPDTYLQEARVLFGIQSLAGRGDQDLANILILNIRSRKNPISVISIKALLQGIETTPVEGQKAFNMKFNSLPAFAKGELRASEQEFSSRVSKVTLDTTLNKAYLTTKYISQLK